jgi:hypothetical protein
MRSVRGTPKMIHAEIKRLFHTGRAAHSFLTLDVQNAHQPMQPIRCAEGQGEKT